MIRRCAWFVLALCMLAPVSADAQTPAPGAEGRLRVYLDCFDCFQEYLRDEIDWVDFVRQPQDADVHLLSTSTDTGGGGEETILRFVGIGRFAGVDQNLRLVSVVNDTENARRGNALRTVTVGLLNYIARGGLPGGIEIEVDVPAAAQSQGGAVADPWNLWVFEIGGDGSVEAEESQRETSWSLGVSGDRVTEDWKISFGIDFEQENQTFNLDEDDEDPLDVEQRDRAGEWFVAKSLGPHWSVGVENRIESSTFENLELSISLSPAVEFSVFPYEDYATRQFVLSYEVGPDWVRYYDVTIFDETKQTLWQQSVAARFDQRQPWGSLEIGVEFSQYLHDLGLYRLETDGDLEFRITRGLSLELFGSASRLRDQVSLPRRGATPEEVLLELRELRSGYDVRFSMGLSYSFGSLFNNVVNPRFDTSDGGGGGN